MLQSNYIKTLDNIKTFSDCLTKAIALSNKTKKEFSLALNIDAASFSRIINDTKPFKPDLIPAACKFLGNTLLADWISYKSGAYQPDDDPAAKIINCLEVGFYAAIQALKNNLT